MDQTKEYTQAEAFLQRYAEMALRKEKLVELQSTTLALGDVEGANSCIPRILKCEGVMHELTRDLAGMLRQLG